MTLSTDELRDAIADHEAMLNRVPDAGPMLTNGDVHDLLNELLKNRERHESRSRSLESAKGREEEIYHEAIEIDLRSLAVGARAAISKGSAGVLVSPKALLALAQGFNVVDNWYDDVCNQLSIYLCEATNGLLSKSNYDAQTMISHTDDAYAKRYEDVIREAKRDAWEEGRSAEALSWEHCFSGHPVPEGDVCDECRVENPYKEEK